MKNVQEILRLSAIALVCVGLYGQGPSTRPPGVTVVPLRQFSFSKDITGDIGLSTIAFDGDRVYVSTPDGSILTADSLASDLQPIYHASGNGISSVYVHDHVLYVLTHPASAEAEEHAMFASKDQGHSFVPIDDGLQTCYDTICSYLVASYLYAADGLLYANAGGGTNLQVSPNGGITWIPLSGILASQLCYSSPFVISGDTVLQGGECPLDNAFLSRGVLGENKQYFESILTPARTPYLSNRKIYGLGFERKSHIALAGGEGILLQSLDDGLSWSTIFEEPDGIGFYPYVPRILFSSSQPGVVVIGGFDKGADPTKPFLAFSRRSGDRLTNISKLLPPTDFGNVSYLAEDGYGRLTALVVDGTHRKVTVCEVRVSR